MVKAGGKTSMDQGIAVEQAVHQGKRAANQVHKVEVRKHILKTSLLDVLSNLS